MKTRLSTRRISLFMLLGLFLPVALAGAQEESQAAHDLDARVRAFLDSRRGTWSDLNVPEGDGQVLHDLIVDRGFTKGLEVGTSTGHSGIWIAWAMAKTGGKLITIEIDRRRHRTAIENFEAAGLSDYIDARLADAHELVPALGGPFDFVFQDADKDWYPRYFELLLPKLEVGGCYTAHNVARGRGGGTREFLEMLESTPNLETEIVRASRSGISVSCKVAEGSVVK